MWIVVGIFVLLAADPAPEPVSESPPVVRERALSYYLQGRLLEERGAVREALANFYRASVLDPKSASLARRVSETAAQLGDASTALEAADRSLQLEPGNARGLWLRGTALFHLKRLDESLAALDSSVHADSTRPEYARSLARAAEHADRLDLITYACETLLEIDPADADAWFQLASAHVRRGHFGAAEKAVARARDLMPLRPGLYFLRAWIEEGLGRPERAVELYRRHLELHPADMAARIRLVPLLVRLERWDDAYDETRALARARPDDPEMTAMLVDLAFKSGRTAEGNRMLGGLWQRAGDDPRALSGVLSVLARNGRGAEAIAEAGKWAARHPDDVQGALLMAQMRALAGTPADAIPDAERAVEMAPDSMASWVMLGRLHFEAERFPEAVDVWRRAAKQFPDDPGIRLELSFSLERAGDMAAAETAVRDVLARWPDNPSALNSLGYLLADQNRMLDEALDLIRRALEADPDNGAFVDSLGWAYFRLGRLEEARVELERAVYLTGGDPIVREHLGDVYNALRLKEMAHEQYRLSLAADGTNDRVRDKVAETR